MNENIFCGILCESRHEKMFMPYANNNDTNQPAHPHSLIIIFVIRFIDSIIPIDVTCKISRPYLDYIAEQTCLSLTWSQPPKTGFLMTWLM